MAGEWVEGPKGSRFATAAKGAGRDRISADFSENWRRHTSLIGQLHQDWTRTTCLSNFPRNLVPTHSARRRLAMLTDSSQMTTTAQWMGRTTSLHMGRRGCQN